VLVTPATARDGYGSFSVTATDFARARPPFAARINEDFHASSISGSGGTNGFFPARHPHHSLRLLLIQRVE